MAGAETAPATTFARIDLTDFGEIYLKSRLKLVLDNMADVASLVRARPQTVAYLLGCGVSRERFQPSQKMLFESVTSQSANPNVLDRTGTNLILVGALVNQALNTFAEVNDESSAKTPTQKRLNSLGTIQRPLWQPHGRNET